MGGNEGSRVGGSYTTPVDDTATEKKKNPPFWGGKRTRMGVGSTPINEKKKDKEAACGMHAASLISQEEGLRAE